MKDKLAFVDKIYAGKQKKPDPENYEAMIIYQTNRRI